MSLEPAQDSPFPPPRRHILVCTNRREEGRACCAALESEALCEVLKDYVKKNRLKERFRVTRTGCLDHCNFKGATVVVYPDNIWFDGVVAEDVPALIERFLSDRPPGRSEDAHSVGAPAMEGGSQEPALRPGRVAPVPAGPGGNSPGSSGPLPGGTLR